MLAAALLALLSCSSPPVSIEHQSPYGAEFVMKGTERDYGHVTQTGFFFIVKGSRQTTAVFAGDRWANFAGNGLGFNQWMPL